MAKWNDSYTKPPTLSQYTEKFGFGKLVILTTNYEVLLRTQNNTECMPTNKFVFSEIKKSAYKRIYEMTNTFPKYEENSFKDLLKKSIISIIKDSENYIFDSYKEDDKTVPNKYVIKKSNKNSDSIFLLDAMDKELSSNQTGLVPISDLLFPCLSLALGHEIISNERIVISNLDARLSRYLRN